MGPAVAISMLFTIAAALTLGPAILTIGSIFGLFDPKRLVKAHLYRRIGAAWCAGRCPSWRPAPPS